uniref:Uncharacterized protein n=1 Tax=Acrobeloides nanus TaxID=290746 RepID=A0A914DAF1_9BILA
MKKSPFSMNETVEESSMNGSSVPFGVSSSSTTNQFNNMRELEDDQLSSYSDTTPVQQQQGHFRHFDFAHASPEPQAQESPVIDHDDLQMEMDENYEDCIPNMQAIKSNSDLSLVVFRRKNFAFSYSKAFGLVIARRCFFDDGIPNRY